MSIPKCKSIKYIVTGLNLSLNRKMTKVLRAIAENSDDNKDPQEVYQVYDIEPSKELHSNNSDLPMYPKEILEKEKRFRKFEACILCGMCCVCSLLSVAILFSTIIVILVTNMEIEYGSGYKIIGGTLSNLQFGTIVSFVCSYFQLDVPLYCTIK